ncbi:DUF6997 domain-containing protein [Candidatus Uabimicrobium amorphum]|uniref:DUF6997 domain-containing protein n=1 Tax=Uabimicrobium amorphum TaxID=2596890 RepID=A0A5S9IR90_UABAM|nr:hypothetical protein [Candidatus Uabimicrobium amorphum]BBM86653.1 hypothetical protein UABAM_05039 [Candidatus Uabimicrobium amorphum]
MSIFFEAIQKLEKSQQLVGQPISFQDYITTLGIGTKNTAQYISINSLNDLSRDLYEADCMVFRLGAPKGARYTHFALAKTAQGWDDYFFIDENIFSSTKVEMYLPDVSVRSLFAYQLLPVLTETSIVNLAIASGLLPHALGISAQQIIPATGKSSFTFEFQPISTCATTLLHNQGQVEIDALFVGQRNDRECLFVVEAKIGKDFSSLAKHKLLYPILSVCEKIPSYMKVVPVYLRVIKKDNSIEFNIAECELSRYNDTFGAMDQLRCHKVKRYVLHGYN